MTERAGESTGERGTAMKRRGILAAAGAVVAGLVAKQTAQSVGATHQPEDVGLNLQNFVGGGSTSISSSPLIAYSNTNIFTVADDFDVSSSRPSAIGAYASGSWVKNGLFAYSNQSGGVAALGVATSGIGVEGQANAAGGIGTLGSSSVGVGVKGVSDTGYPLIGQAVALWSISPGVTGIGTAGPGVQGQSSTGHGLIGYTTAADGHAALIGYAQATGGVGLIGVAPGNAGHWAGVFYGDVHIAGTMAAPVTGAIAAHPDGTSRLLPGVAAPEGWFEDFGRGTLANGTAEIKLDAEFAALVHTDDYHVFAMPEGPQHLHVAGRTATGFTVVATSAEGRAGGVKAPVQQEGGGTFSWRVVARRKDGARGRLAKVAPPPAPKPFAPAVVPETPEAKPPTKKP